MLTLLRLILWGGFFGSAVYSVFALFRVVTFRRAGRKDAGAFRPSVTIAKPICGMDAGLEENLRSFLHQDYPEYQVVFGVRDPADPAVETIRRVMDASPGSDTVLVSDRCVDGTNRKVCNLVSIVRRAKHDIIVIADSDIRFDPGSLSGVVAPFEDEAVGAVTCLHVADPVKGVPSKLGAMFINGEFLPAILVALALEPLTYCFGPTMAVRRSALLAIGGFEALAGHVADDYLLGNLITRLGLKVELASCVVTNILYEPSLRSLFLHELRWARTIRTVRPIGYAASVISMVTPWALAVLLATGFTPAGWLAVVAALGLRAGIHLAVKARFRLRQTPELWWIPFRDLLSFFVYCSSHAGRRVHWRANRFTVSADGHLHPEEVGT